ncbi:hypothetical protein [Luteolibacter sp. LG18]|uniref:hypothetical protein n=1 Tax=Luteolibacter sp. LG18 TaxID=2819286 RepID=UPI002B2BEFC7|nr:hypothetical protein llg_28000 [Luteolibacter sp. LG18]
MKASVAIAALAPLVALVSPLHAAPEVRTVEASFYCFQYAPGAETLEIVSSDHQQPVRLSTANISKPVMLQVSGDEAVIQRRVGDQLVPAARVKVAADIAKALVVLVPAASGSTESYRARAIDYSQDRFPLGTYQLLNISGTPVRGAIGPSYAEVKPGAIGGIALQGENGTVQGVRFEFLETGKWSRLTETRCAVRRDRRWLVCVYQDPSTQRMNMRSIPDRSFAPNTAVALSE